MNNEAVSIELLGTSYQIKCPSSEVELLHKAAQFLEEKMQAVRATGIISMDRVAVITALNLAHEIMLLKNQSQQQHQTMNQHLGHLLHKVETALGSQAQLELQPAE